MDYRIAKQIRGAKFTDLMAANIVKGGSTMGSFKKAVSQKAKAKATRFKEKFDPLNIAKFLTGGSKLAPAILGRLLGRSQRDIEYFSGTAKLIGGKATRIGTVEKQGSELGILTDIYKFLKKSYDDDKKQKDLQSDFAEEKKLEDERRHKELLDAIRGARTYTPMVEKEKETGGGLLDMIKSMFESFKNSISGLVSTALEKLLGGKGILGSLIRFLGSRVFTLLLGPLAGIASIAGLILLLSKFFKLGVDKIPDFTELTSEEAKNVLANGSPRDIEFFGGEERLKAIAFGDASEAKQILERDDREEIMRAGGKAFLERIAAGNEMSVTPQTPTELRPVTPRSIWGGGGPQKEKDWDYKFGATHNPDGTPKTMLPAKPLLSGVEAATESSRADAAATDPRRVDLPTGPAFGVRPMGIPRKKMEPPASMPGAGAGSNLTPAVNQNQNLKLDEKMTSNAPPVSRPATVATPKVSSVVQRQPIPPVRNMEESFQRMIYNSIRVV